MRAFVLSILMAGGLANASPVHVDAAHEHGVAVLRVVSEGSTLMIEFVSALDNLVGFEHAPRTDARCTALRAAQARLRDAAALAAGLPGH